MKILSAIIFLISLQIYGGAWPQPKGGYYAKLTYIYSYADSIYGVNYPAKFRDHALYIYSEYGLTNKLTLSINGVLYKRSTLIAEGTTNATFGYLAGDFSAMLQYQIVNDPFVLSGGIGGKFPLFYNFKDRPPLGNGNMDLDLKLLFGYSSPEFPGYFAADLGYRIRGGEFIDEINFSSEVGINAVDNITLRGAINGVLSVDKSAGEGTLVGFPLAQEQVKAGAGLTYKLTSNVDVDFMFFRSITGDLLPNYKDIFLGISLRN